MSDNSSTIHPKKNAPPATLSDFIAEGKKPDYNTRGSKNMGQGDVEEKSAFDHSAPLAQGKGREGMEANNETRGTKMQKEGSGMENAWVALFLVLFFGARFGHFVPSSHSWKPVVTSGTY